MAKSEVTQEQALNLADRLAQELGLIRKDTSSFFRWYNPANKHNIYIQKSRFLNRIDFTVNLPTDDPMYRQLTAGNGSISCHIVPSLENVERAMRMMVDAGTGALVQNKPRPFAPTKAPPARKPKPVEEPMPEVKLEPVPQGGSLADRLEAIREQARHGKVQRLLQDPETYGEMTADEAEELVDSKVSLEEYARTRKQRLESAVIIAEAGLDDIVAEALS
jgi:hypothetical protein